MNSNAASYFDQNLVNNEMMLTKTSGTSITTISLSKVKIRCTHEFHLNKYICEGKKLELKSNLAPQTVPKNVFEFDLLSCLRVY